MGYPRDERSEQRSGRRFLRPLLRATLVVGILGALVVLGYRGVQALRNGDVFPLRVVRITGEPWPGSPGVVFSQWMWTGCEPRPRPCPGWRRCAFGGYGRTPSILTSRSVSPWGTGTRSSW